MKYSIIVVFLLLFMTTSCDDDMNTSVLTNSDRVRVDDDLFDTAPRDNIELEEVNLTGNTLKIKFFYGGGCGEIYYDLVADSEPLQSTPVQINVRLAVDDQDNCEAGLYRMVSIDISELQLPATDMILINLEGWDQQIEYRY